MDLGFSFGGTVDGVIVVVVLVDDVVEVVSVVVSSIEFHIIHFIRMQMTLHSNVCTNICFAFVCLSPRGANHSMKCIKVDVQSADIH